jgi:site-specific recombinase XerD
MNGDLIVLPEELEPVPSSADGLLVLADFLRLNVAQGDASERTIRAYLDHIRQFVGWCRDNEVNPSTASETDLARYRRFLSGAGYTRSTVSVKLSALRQFYQAAVWRGLRADNPAEGLKAPPDHTTQADRIIERYLSPQAVHDLLAAPDCSTVTGRRDVAMMSLMYYHGLRVSEVAHLKMTDIRHGDPPRLTIRRSKGRKTRTNALVGVTAQRVQTWLEDREKLWIRRSGNAVFLSLSKAQRRQPITTPGVRWVVKKYLKVLDLYEQGVGPHALRHAHITHALVAGADLHAVSREVGHSSTATTSIYVHVIQALMENPASFLESTGIP